MGIPVLASLSQPAAAVWDGKVWVTATKDAPQYPGQMTARAVSAPLTTLDISTGQSVPAGITLQPAPLGLLVVDGNLWAVSESVVFLIDGKQAIPRYPVRGLIEPTRPFNYEGKLAVIDKDKNDVYSLLTWDGSEWTEVGKIDVPMLVVTRRWAYGELRVIQDETSTYLFFSDGSTVMYRDGIDVVLASEPVSALTPQNLVTSGGLDPSIAVAWNTTPLMGGWNGLWDVTFVDGEMFAVQTTFNGTGIQVFRNRNGGWVPISLDSRLQITSFSLTSGTPAYLVDNKLHLYLVNGANGLQRIQAGIPSSQNLHGQLQFLTVLIPYLLATAVLVWPAQFLISRNRNPRYLYGKRLVDLAPLGRRAIARAIDTMITAFPPFFWFFIAVTDGPSLQQPYRVLGQPSLQFVMFLSIMGMWLGAILILSVMEGLKGITPGKWVCGIKTLRTTLRPCGVLRALTRQLLVYVDGLALIAWTPGVLTIAFTKDWQRIGDLVADTVVVRDGSAETSRAVES